MADHTQTLAVIVDLIRRGLAVTRPELVRQTDLGRAVISQRVEELIDLGLLVEQGEGVSTGGRPSRILRLGSERGVVLAAVFGATRLHVAIADLSGSILADRLVQWNVDAGPEASMGVLTSTADELLREFGDTPLWGGAIGVPGPVDFATGKPVAPPIMSGWHDFPIRGTLERHYGVPVWVDNDVNLMALGAWHETRSSVGDNVLMLKAGTGIGAGLISRGRLHRGARGGAGDIGHISITERSSVRCRCGNLGCLEAYAGGWAIARDAEYAARGSESSFLGARLEEHGSLSIEDVIAGTLEDDTVSVELVDRAGSLIGRELAGLVNFFNPSTVLVSGSLARTGERFLQPIRDAVKSRSLPLAVSELLIVEPPLQHYEGIIGAAALVMDELLSPRVLATWLGKGTPKQMHGGHDGFIEDITVSQRLDSLAAKTELSKQTLPALPFESMR